MAKRPCYVVDAFSAEPLAGNPAGVLLDGASLDKSAMQRVAGELKHSETAFPLPAREPQSSLHLRWFTPTAEVAFCGHATLAAFHVLVEEAKRIRVPEQGVTRVSFTCLSGRLTAELSRDAQKQLQVLIETPASKFETVQLPLDVLTALGIIPEVIDPKIAPARSAILEGNLYLAVRDRDALSRCKPDSEALFALGKQLNVAGFVVYTLNPKPGVDAAMRCFFPDIGITEDPVTGSAAGQLGVLIQQSAPEIMPRKLVITQGDEVGRPGRVEVEVRPEATPGQIRGWIGGKATVVLRGELFL